MKVRILVYDVSKENWRNAGKQKINNHSTLIMYFCVYGEAFIGDMIY